MTTNPPPEPERGAEPTPVYHCPYDHAQFGIHLHEVPPGKWREFSVESTKELPVTTTLNPTRPTLRAPFPYFGGKRSAAERVWSLLGDPGGYTEPFAGSIGVLLGRPPLPGRRVETINDVDGWVVNAWRAIQLAPDLVARAAYGPVTEVDLNARLAWLQERRDGLLGWLEGNPEAFDPKAAGWWVYVLSNSIADPFLPGRWQVLDQHLVDTRIHPHPHPDRSRGVNRKLPHLGSAGKGINRQLGGETHSGLDALTGYLGALAERIGRVRITCGDWRRVLSPAVLAATAGGDGSRGIFLDPPYADSPGLYPGSTTTTGSDTMTGSDTTTGSDSTAVEVQEWCLSAPPHLRIVLAGYDSDHTVLESHGWRVSQGLPGRGSGYSTNPDAGRRERLWSSPACLDPAQETLFEMST